MNTPTPHLVVLSSLSMVVRPIRARDTGGGQYLALWSDLHTGIARLQSIACDLDLVATLPLPASYSLLTARFLVRCAPRTQVACFKPKLRASNPSPADQTGEGVEHWPCLD